MKVALITDDQQGATRHIQRRRSSHLAIWYRQGTVLPNIGAIDLLSHHGQAIYDLREPESIEELRANPGVYGIPHPVPAESL